jgi:hypothetical protein
VLVVGSVIGACLLVAAPALATPPIAVPAASQYVEQIPTATGTKATTAHHTAASTSSTTAPTSTSAGKQSTGTRATSKHPASHTARAKTTSATKQEPTPFRAALATSNGTTGFGRGALLALVVAAVTLVALTGLAVRRRISR